MGRGLLRLPIILFRPRISASTTKLGAKSQPATQERVPQGGAPKTLPKNT